MIVEVAMSQVIVRLASHVDCESPSSDDSFQKEEERDGRNITFYASLDRFDCWPREDSQVADYQRN